MKLMVDADAPRQPEVVQFELEGWIDTSPFEHLLGIRTEMAAAGTARLSMPFTVKLANGDGVMHGGAMTALADTAVAMAIKSLLPAGTTFATTALSIEFIAPVLTGVVTACARVRGPQGRLFHGECELCGPQGEIFARLTAVFKIARGSL